MALSRLTLAGLVITLAPALAHAGGHTIVGTWAPNPHQCTPAEGMIGIDPLGMTGDEFRCDFSDVSRSGNTVLWHGSCGGPESSSKSTVVADLRGQLLFMRINGAPNGPYQRCTPKAEL